MIPSNLSSLLAGRKKYVDDNDKTLSGIAIGTGSRHTSRLTDFDEKYIEKSLTGYTGLINQGATCYLNSLIQTLYMIPEFRMELYLSHFEENEEDDNETNLAYQLQKLFCQLQLTLRGALTTTSLTKSFGWSHRDSFTQQDIQECMTVIFDYITQQYSHTSISQFILSKWSGELKIGLKCVNCHNIRYRNEVFRDIQLQVHDVTSINESFDIYTKIESLDGVTCEICNNKYEHHKSIEFSKLPFILSLQLRRFDMNWNTMQR
jgi:ubiquitin carboxyl-terminal hydrolase 47